jgi:hypothetical protein
VETPSSVDTLGGRSSMWTNLSPAVSVLTRPSPPVIVRTTPARQGAPLRSAPLRGPSGLDGLGAPVPGTGDYVMAGGLCECLPTDPAMRLLATLTSRSHPNALDLRCRASHTLDVGGFVRKGPSG